MFSNHTPQDSLQKVEELPAFDHVFFLSDDLWYKLELLANNSSSLAF